MACGTQLGCTIILVIVILVVCYTSTGSLNPLDVYTQGSTAAKVAVSVIAVVASLGFLQALLVAGVRGNIRKTTGMPPDNVRCEGCHNPLLAFTGIHGQPIICPNCNKWWHRRCFYGAGGTLLGGCPDCQKKESWDDAFASWREEDTPI